jgi:cyclopropane-fatty-acyl-phospholipid synthase
VKKTIRAEHQLYHAYTVDEDRERTNVHYEHPAEFFLLITGGRWNVYSCNLWEPDTADDTEAQEAKLDLIADLAGLRAGMRLLDVGCGWGGPLTYLCKCRGLQGVGLTLSPSQKAIGDRRIAFHGVDAQVVIGHWQDYRDDRPFDVVYTDEVITHFNDLKGFFDRCYSLLRPEGVMINKELHLKHPRHALLRRGAEFVSALFGDTGNYRTLSEELRLANEAGFDVERVHHISRRYYDLTIEHWLSNMAANQERLTNLVGKQYYHDFRNYLRLARRAQRNVTLDAIVCRRVN